MIIEVLNSSEATRRFADELSIDRLNELMDMSDILARNTAEEYKILVKNVMEAAFRQDAYWRLKKCQDLCCDSSIADIEDKIYELIDEIMTEYSTVDDIPAYSKVVDECWAEILRKQQDGFSGFPFKFPLLNEFATLDRGELFLFGAGPKQGKSIMLLNIAVALLMMDLSILYIDSELSTRMFTARLIAHLTGIKYRDINAGNYSEEDLANIAGWIGWIKTKKFTHKYIPIFDKQSIYTTIKKVYHTQGIDVLIVDYFKGGDEGDAFDIYRDLGGVVNMIKNQVCGDMNIAGLGAVQTTETGKVADSQRIVRNASTIAIIQPKTPEEIEEDGEECGNKKLRVVYNRNGMQHAAGEYIDLRFDGDHILYEQAEKQHIPHTPF